MPLDLTPLEQVLRSPTDVFTRLSKEPRDMKQRLSSALCKSGLPTVIKLIAEALGQDEPRAPNSPIVHRRRAAPAKGKAGLVYTSLRWNNSYDPHIKDDYEEQLGLFMQDASGRSTALLVTTVVQNNLTTPVYSLDGINLPALKLALPEMSATLLRACPAPRTGSVTQVNTQNNAGLQ